MTNLLRTQLSNTAPTYIIGCHDALSAIVAEQAGFDSIWVSSLGLSTVQGRRDFGELSWAEVVAATENIASATQAAILVDGDNGHGDFNIARFFAKKLFKAGASGISIEDQVFPKRNSLMSAGQELEDKETFCGKIRAIKDALGNDMFLVARVEALIVGQGLDVAKERANLYAEAGADAILIHSKSKEASDIVRFIEDWDKPNPIVIVPTTYYSSIAPVIPRLKSVKGIIWANQLLRAQILALKNASRELLEQQDPRGVSNMVTVKEVLSLTGMDLLPSEERKYNRQQKPKELMP